MHQTKLPPAIGKYLGRLVSKHAMPTGQREENSEFKLVIYIYIYIYIYI